MQRLFLHKTYVLLILFLVTGIVEIRAQDQLIREGSVSGRRSEIRDLPVPREKSNALRVADSLGIPTRMVYPDGRVVEIREIGPGGQPEYLTTHNLNAARTVSSDAVWPGGGAGYGLSGKGIVVGLWDGGVFRETHVEFIYRAFVIDQLAEVIGHATHVAGTVGAAGIDERARGMAGNVVMEAYDWDRDVLEMGVAAGQGLLISNHSYGFITGWDYNLDEERWEWYGDRRLSENEDYLFGFYHREAQDYDRVAYNNPYYLIVKSAGNDRGEGPSPGTEHYVWEDGEWVPSTVVREKDGGEDGFDSMGPVGNAKNIMTVGAIRDLPLGYTGRENVMITSFSGYGPTDDGRIKPDIVGNGEALFSPYSGSDTDYRNSSGTSMSAPNISGSLALLQELHFSLYGTYLRSSSLKGVALHTADDAGNPGPDYRFGWGVMNTRAAADLIADGSFDRVVEDSILENGEYRAIYYSSGDQPVRVTICWTDPPGTVPEPALDPVSKILSNDLDIRLIRTLDGQVFEPFVLDPLHPGDPATTGDNDRDNVEQVYLQTPAKGFYELVISHKGSLVNDRQDFALVISGLTDEFFASGIAELTGNNGEFILTSASEYLPDMDAAWLIVPENGQPVRLYFSSFSTEPGSDRLRVYDGADTTAPLIAVLEGSIDLEGTEILSSSGSLLVTFTSDEQDQRGGFTALYCTTAPETEPWIQGEPYPCSGSSELYLAMSEPGAAFAWEPPPGWAILDTVNGGITLSIGSQLDSLKSTSVNRCGAGPSSYLLLDPRNGVPSLSAYTADTVPCAGTMAAVQVDDHPGTTYRWRLPQNWLGTSRTSRLEYVPGKDPGIIQVESGNACGNGDTLLIPISVKNVPDAVQILSGREKPCAMSQQEFFVVPEEDHSYRWEVGDDWSILGNDTGDTVLVAVGMQSNFLFVEVTNKCGSRSSNRLFITSPMPEDPLLKVNNSEVDGYRQLTITNAGLYSGFQWLRNEEPIESNAATGPEIIAYLPGIYTVAVTNREGCVNRMDPADGIDIDQENQVFTVFPGRSGRIIVLNSSSASALVHIYDYMGRILKIETVGPGHNEIPFNGKGVFIVSVTGNGRTLSTRVFTR